MELVIRPAVEGDLEGINELYNYYVLETPITFDIDPITMDQRKRWFEHFDIVGRNRLLVAVGNDSPTMSQHESVLGFASSGRYRDKRAYETSVATSIYLAAGWTGRGIGSRLYESLFKELENEDIHRAYAGITMPNPASVAIHERFGFRRAGLYREQGRKFGRYWDVAWYEKEVGGK